MSLMCTICMTLLVVKKTLLVFCCRCTFVIVTDILCVYVAHLSDTFYCTIGHRVGYRSFEKEMCTSLKVFIF